MVETKVPIDIRAYKAKLVGPFTTRQLICIVISGLLDILIYFTIISPLGISLKIGIFIMIFADFPVLLFTVEPLGMPMEKYIKSVLLKNLMAPIKRKAANSLFEETSGEYTPKEIKESQKRMKQLIKTHPEYKPYH